MRAYILKRRAENEKNRPTNTPKDQKSVKEETLAELNKDTIRSYIRKAEKDIGTQRREISNQLWAGKPVEADKASARMINRFKGVHRAIPRFNKESTVCDRCQTDPCICDDSHGFVGEARMSAAERLSRAWDKQRAKSDASLRRTPSSIPVKKEESK